MPRQKEFDYDEKLVAARELFWEKGYNATSMNDLVDRLKINRSSLYLTYGSKHDLFIKSLNSYNKLKGEEYKGAATSSDNPLESVKNMVLAVLEVILKDDKTCMVVNSSFELARIDDEVKSMVSSQIGWSIQTVENLLKKAQEKQLISADKDIKALAHFIIMSMTSLWHTQVVFGDAKLTRQMANVLIENITK